MKGCCRRSRRRNPLLRKERRRITPSANPPYGLNLASQNSVQLVIRYYFLFAAASFLICSMMGPSSFSAAASSALSCSGGQRASVCWMA
jgi:hypothetical protein